MRNAESDIRQLIGLTLAVIAETKSIIRELDAMDYPVIGRKNQTETGPSFSSFTSDMLRH
jgi:hypothetical protein